MHDEERDPELEALRPYWKPPAPPDHLDARVLRAYRRGPRARRRLQRLWIPLAAALAVTAISGWLIGIRRQTRPAPAGYGMAFVPVRQPRVVVVSQGERP